MTLPCSPSSSTAVSLLLAQLSYKTIASFSRPAHLLRRLRAQGALQLLDANSLSLAPSRSGHAPLASSLLVSMLRRAYTAAVACLAPLPALRLFDSVLHNLRRVPADLASSSRPDAAAFNAALSRCADAGDCRRFRELFEEMPKWNASPDALTYNVAIKMCARAGRMDLPGRVLERMLSSGLTPCATTLHSLVAAYAGFGDISTAERIERGAGNAGRAKRCVRGAERGGNRRRPRSCSWHRC